ncbi:hypothetical protein [Pararhizobium sp.]|uniref:hypothetical protein n=1 Tax=Pararhizobium sp. TaxID=1977563 RepID=UPI003D12C1A1
MGTKTLKEIVSVLENDATNYAVFLESFEMSLTQPSTSVAQIKTALGEGAVLSSIEEVQNASVWTVVEEALLYAGDPGAGPSAAVMASEKLASLMDALKKQVGELVKTATKTESFSLRDGHPAYPVFWDFALLFQNATSATILMGSSSD